MPSMFTSVFHKNINSLRQLKGSRQDEGGSIRVFQVYVEQFNGVETFDK